MISGFPIRSAATLVGAGFVAGVAFRSHLGWGVFLGCCALTIGTLGLGFLSEALRERQVAQCGSEACLGFCQPAVLSIGDPTILHGGDPP